MGSLRVRLDDVHWQLAEREEYISALQKKIEKLEELLEERNERILYLGTRRFEPFLRSKIFDALLPPKSKHSRSSVCANTGLMYNCKRRAEHREQARLLLVSEALSNWCHSHANAGRLSS